VENHAPEGSEAGGHAHNFDELYPFLSSGPHDTLNLGGEVELWLGEGNEAEKYIITKATGAWIPAGLMHNPHYFRRVDRPFLMVIISMTSDYSPKDFRCTPLPAGFRM
jgi:hypothetical protein